MPGNAPSDGNDLSDRPNRSDPSGPARPGPAGAGGAAVLRNVLTARIPLWSALTVTLTLVALLGALLLSREHVDLGRAVDGAVDATVSLTVCNETVDRRAMNPRTEELAFEDGLEALGVAEANVMVNRIDCGVDAP